MVAISVVEADLLTRPCDLMILKQAAKFSGADKLVAAALDHSRLVEQGDVVLLPGAGSVAAKQVMFVGVGRLLKFRYPQIRAFAAQTLAIAQEAAKSAEKICMPVHGPGYGLDETESFLSLLGGLADGVGSGRHPPGLRHIEIVEINPNRAARFSALLKDALSKAPLQPPVKGAAEASDAQPKTLNPDSLQKELVDYGAQSEKKIRLFVAMPFKDEYIDEWEIAISDAAGASEIICERLDRESFVGDITAEIKGRIETYNGLIALLNGANPNVYLEVGYAWGKNKPAVLVIKKGEELPFDVRAHRCIMYTNISDLRRQLTDELLRLKKGGVFSA